MTTQLPIGKPTDARVSSDGYVAICLEVTEHLRQPPVAHWFVLTTNEYGHVTLNHLQPGETDDWTEIPLPGQETASP